ncbi:SNF2-related protein [Candidatus Amarobacter glycogenicus]|uniref:SNF2-related protein n=1 Tax=Candidatus Amarobacter glycogenicus TaxID=3140699 RepID=UPI00313566D6|nr:hypothetical protein [Dehalococcoidia bacterium]
MAGRTGGQVRSDRFCHQQQPGVSRPGAGAWERYPRVIASLGHRAAPNDASAILAKEYDLVIVDERPIISRTAHRPPGGSSTLQKKYILLLTATPVQNRLTELHNLVTVLKPGQLKSPKEFSQQFVVRGDPRLPKNRALLRELLGDVMVRHTRGQISLKLPPRRPHPFA